MEEEGRGRTEEGRREEEERGRTEEGKKEKDLKEPSTNESKKSR